MSLHRSRALQTSAIRPFIIIPSIILRAQRPKAGSQGYFRSDWSALTEVSKSKLLIGQTVRTYVFPSLICAPLLDQLFILYSLNY